MIVLGHYHYIPEFTITLIWPCFSSYAEMSGSLLVWDHSWGPLLFPCQPHVTFCKVKGPAVSPGESGLVAMAIVIGLNDVKVHERCRDAHKWWTSPLSSPITAAGTKERSYPLLSLDTSESLDTGRSPVGGIYSFPTAYSLIISLDYFIPDLKGVCGTGI